MSEVNAAGDILWETTPRYPGGATAATYRVHRAPFPDAMRPRVVMSSPASGATFLQGRRVRANWFCTDEGGSSIATCDGSTANGTLLDTSTPGPHTITVSAIDGAGNERQFERTYEVVADQPDVAVRNGTDGRLVGNNVYNRNGAGQTRNANVPRLGTAVFTAVVQNDGVDADTFRIHGSDHDADFTVRYFDGDRDVTAAIKAGAYRIADLAPGARHDLQVRIGARASSTTADAINVFLEARSTTNTARRDTGKFVVNRTGAESAFFESPTAAEARSRAASG